MITNEELFNLIISLIVLFYISKKIYKMFEENNQLKYENLSISKIQKDVKKRLKKYNKNTIF